MATRQELQAEAYRRGLMPPDARAVYEEGVRRGIVKDDFATGKLRGAKGDGWATFQANIPLHDEFTAAVDAGVGAIQGKGSFGQNWRSIRDQQAGRDAGFSEAHPIAANAVKGTAFDLQALPAFFTGGASLAPNVFRAAPVGLKEKAVEAATAVGKNALAGGTITAGNVFAGRGTLGERVTDAGHAVPGGMATGALVPAVLGAPGAIKRGVRAVAEGPVGRTTARAANNAATKAGKGFLDPQAEALKRMGETLRADGLAPEEIQAAMTEWNRVGGPSPAFMDLIAKRAPRTMALIRGSAMSGGGRGVATAHGEQVAADLQDNAIARTRQMSPEKRPAAEVAASMREQRGKLATEQYQGPYDAQVRVSPETREVLTDAPGKAALRQARADAVERRDVAQVREIDALLAAEPEPTAPYEWSRPPPETVSGATLDRTQIAMRERGDKLARAGNNARAGGARDRRSVINRELDAVPALKGAREAYRTASQNIEGVEKVGPNVTRAMPDEYAADVARLGPQALPAVRVGATRALEETIGRPAEGSTGALNRIGTSTNTRRNLETTFGQEPASDYRQAINQMKEQLQNARHINPNTGSQTAGRLDDQSLVEGALDAAVALKSGGLITKVTGLLGKVKRGATLSDAEREVIVRLATGKISGPMPDLEQAIAPPPSRIEFNARPMPNIYAIPALADQPNRR